MLASGNITIGDHHGVWHVAGLTIYVDVVWTTLLAAAIVLAFGLRMRAKVTSGVPGKLQLFWETPGRAGLRPGRRRPSGPRACPSSAWA